MQMSPTIGRSFPWRRPSRSSYELVLAELLLQQTRAAKVAEIFPAIVRRCPDWDALAAIASSELEILLRPLGLYRRRAAALRALAKVILERGLPTSASELEELPGIGQYMARAIAVQLAGEIVAPIDTNVARVLERVYGPRRLADIRHDPQLQQLALALMPPSSPAQYFMTLLDFGAVICRPGIPLCDICPIQACHYRAYS